MPVLRWSLLCLLMLAAMPAYAIPPPDVVLSLWQSVLQLLGVVSVFLAGGFFAMRQFFSQYVVGWKRKLFYLWVVAAVGVMAWLLVSPALAASPNAPVKGESLPIETVIGRDHDTWVRDWKLQTVHEMQNELNTTRARKRLPKVAFQTIESFSPPALADLLKTRAGELYLLDMREPLELSRFSIPHQAVFRYGDLAQDIVPVLPADKMVVVLCHSGLRGYLAANLLKQAGHPRVAFLQGGLAQWTKDGLPFKGNADYKVQPRPLFNKAQATQFQRLKVQVDPDGTLAVKLPGLLQLPYETASTRDLQPVLQAARQQPVLLVCSTYGGCFHSNNLAWLIEQQGGKVAGIYDASGQQMHNFFD